MNNGDTTGFVRDHSMVDPISGIFFCFTTGILGGFVGDQLQGMLVGIPDRLREGPALGKEVNGTGVCDRNTGRREVGGGDAGSSDGTCVGIKDGGCVGVGESEGDGVGD